MFFVKKYSVDYGYSRDSFKHAKDAYPAGWPVRLVFMMESIGTDTDYSFFVDDKRVNARYSPRKGYVISFRMPAKNIKVSVRANCSMVPGEE